MPLVKFWADAREGEKLTETVTRLEGLVSQLLMQSSVGLREISEVSENIDQTQTDLSGSRAFEIGWSIRVREVDDRFLVSDCAAPVIKCRAEKVDVEKYCEIIHDSKDGSDLAVGCRWTAVFLCLIVLTLSLTIINGRMVCARERLGRKQSAPPKEASVRR